MLMARVRLTRKFANLINGIDLSHRRPGDVLELTDSEARMLILEGWATASDAGLRKRKLIQKKISPETFEEWNREGGRTKPPERMTRKTKKPRNQR